MASPRSWLHCLFHFSELERGDTTPRMEASCAPVLDHYTSVIHAFQFAQSSASPLNGDDEDLLTHPAIGYLLLGHNRPPCSRGVSLHLTLTQPCSAPQKPSSLPWRVDRREILHPNFRGTSENAQKAKFAEILFYAFWCISRAAVE